MRESETVENARRALGADLALPERQIKPLLDQCGYVIEPAGRQLKTLADLSAYARAHGVELTPNPKPAR